MAYGIPIYSRVFDGQKAAEDPPSIRETRGYGCCGEESVEELTFHVVITNKLRLSQSKESVKVIRNMMLWPENPQ